MTTLNGSLVGFPPVQVLAMKGTFSSLTASNAFTGVQSFGASFSVDTGTKVATASAGAATLNKLQGKVTSEAITTAAGSDYTLTITNSTIAAADMVIAMVENGTNTTEGISVQRVQPAAGSVVVHVRNTHASSALNGTIVVKFVVIKA